MPVADLLKERPELLTFMRSGMAALPFGANFWGDLARGMRIEEKRAVSWVEQLQQADVLRGAWLEPNPDFPRLHERIVFGDPPDGALARWTALCDRGLVGSYLIDGSPKRSPLWSSITTWATTTRQTDRVPPKAPLARSRRCEGRAGFK